MLKDIFNAFASILFDNGMNFIHAAIELIRNYII